MEARNSSQKGLETIKIEPPVVDLRGKYYDHSGSKGTTRDNATKRKMNFVRWMDGIT